MQQQANFGKLFLRPVIILAVVLAVAIGFVVGFGELLLHAAESNADDIARDSLARREIWVDLIPAAVIVIAAGLIAYSPKGRFAFLERRTLIGKQPIFTPPAPGAAELSRRGLAGDTGDIAPGYSLFLDDVPLGYVVGLVPRRGVSGPFLYAAGFEGASRQIWVPTSAVREVYPDTRSVYLTARRAESDTWATMPAAARPASMNRR